MLGMLVGVAGASVFWLYGPHLQREIARQVAEAVKAQPLTVEVERVGPGDPKKLPAQAVGPRFQLVADGRQVFLADLQEGRVWRYFQHTKEGGYPKEEEGFLSLPLFQGGKKYFRASDLDQVPSKPGETPPKPGEKRSK